MIDRKNIVLLLTSFFTGFCVMTIELVASRIVAPILGNSLYSWTSIIGVILLGLSLGSFLGGKIADKYGNKYLAIQFLISSLSTFSIIYLLKEGELISSIPVSILYLNLFLSTYLFLLPAILLGTIQPVILKIYSKEYSNIASEYGLLSALWSLGSILGVFSTGFYLVASFGSTNIIATVSIVLAIISIIFSRTEKNIAIIVTILMISYMFLTEKDNQNIIFNKETSYYNIKVVDIFSDIYGKTRTLFLDIDSHSMQSENIIKEYYTEIYPIFGMLKEDINKVLLVGAGAYTLPKYISEYYNNINIEVIEIDKELEKVARDYFELNKYNIMTIISDARIFLKNTQSKYDLIYGDAYNSFVSVPFHLMTNEFNRNILDKLNDGGIYAINIIASENGSGKEFYKSVASTFEKTFPNSFAIFWRDNPNATQNITFIGIKSEEMVNLETIKNRLSSNKTHNFLAKYIKPIETMEGLILTDNYAPVETLMSPLIKEYFPNHLSFVKSLK